MWWLVATALATNPASFAPPVGAPVADWSGPVHAAGMAVARPGGAATVALVYDGGWSLHVGQRCVPVRAPDSPQARADIVQLAASLAADLGPVDEAWTVPAAPLPKAAPPRAARRTPRARPVPTAPVPPLAPPAADPPADPLDAVVIALPDPVDPAELDLPAAPDNLTFDREPRDRVLQFAPLLPNPNRPLGPTWFWGRALAFGAWEPGATDAAGGLSVEVGVRGPRLSVGADLSFRRASLADHASFSATEFGLVADYGWEGWGRPHLGVEATGSIRNYTLSSGNGSPGAMACAAVYGALSFPIATWADAGPILRAQGDLGSVSFIRSTWTSTPSWGRMDVGIALDVHRPKIP